MAQGRSSNDSSICFQRQNLSTLLLQTFSAHHRKQKRKTSLTSWVQTAIQSSQGQCIQWRRRLRIQNNCFQDYWIVPYGIPDFLLTYDGPHFVNTFFARLYKFLAVKPMTTTDCHPQTSKLVERFRRTIVGHIRRYAVKYHNNWDIFV